MNTQDEREPMTNLGFMVTLEMMREAAEEHLPDDLDQFIARCKDSESTAWFIDPTLYRRGADALIAMRKMAEAARAFKTAAAAFELERAKAQPRV